MTMNQMNPQGMKCKDCGDPLLAGVFWINKGQTLFLSPGDPREGPYCWRCYRRHKMPGWTDNTVNKNKNKPVRVNTERSRANVVGGDPRGEL